MPRKPAPWETDDTEQETAPAKKAPAKKAPAKKKPAKKKPPAKKAPAKKKPPAKKPTKVKAPAKKESVAPVKSSNVARTVGLEEKELLEVLEDWRLTMLEIVAFKDTVKKEKELRQALVGMLLEDPSEGVNNCLLPGNWVLRVNHKIDRKIDEEVIQDVAVELRDLGVNADTLVEWKPSVKLATYRELPEEAALVFDQALTIKPAFPSVELLPPKEEDS